MADEQLRFPANVFSGVTFVVGLSRAYWRELGAARLLPITRAVIEGLPETVQKMAGSLRLIEYASVLRNTFHSESSAPPPAVLAYIEARLAQLGFFAEPPPAFGLPWTREDRLLVHRDLLDPLTSCLRIFAELADQHDIQYFVMRAIRVYYGLSLSGEIVGYFHILADTLTSHISDKDNREYRIKEDISGFLGGAAKLSRFSLPGLSSGELFLECCRAANYFSLGRNPGSVWFYANLADGEYLLSRLFGIPTGISGFDMLFSSGGILLADQVIGSDATDVVPGRLVLSAGRFGTGKTILGLQMAGEIARKGGVAWVIPLEQSISECLYVLESMGISSTDSRFVVAKNALEAEEALQHNHPTRGAIIFLRHESDDYGQFIALLETVSQRMAAYALRLIVIDPINAIPRQDHDEKGNLRAKVAHSLQRIRSSQTNVWLNAEDEFFTEHEYFEQKISDTVLRLAAQEEGNRTHRYIEVEKSRLQRERRGHHPYSILPNHGFSIHPAPHAWTSVARGRSIRSTYRFTHFGVPGLDDVIGERGLGVYDLIVLQGPTGTFKTLAGLLFLLGNSRDENSSSRSLARSLLITDREDVSVSTLFDPGAANFADRPPSKPIDVLRIETGDVQPGEILRRIAIMFERLKRSGSSAFYDRVMIDNLSRWEVSCPLIRDNDEFGLALVEYFRRHSVTTLFTCGDSVEANQPTLLQRAVVDGSDCLIRCFLFELQGRVTPFLRVLKSRNNKHKTDLVEVRRTATGIAVSNSPIPYRPGPSGTLTPVDVRLILHAETNIQESYNQQILNYVRSTISRKTELVDRSSFPQAIAYHASEISGTEEVQVIQLDEFELALLSSSGFHEKVLPYNPTSRLPRIATKTESLGLAIVPLYINVAFLVYNSNRIPTSALASWTALAEAAEAWETRDGNNVFFDCAFTRTETFNCCFLEILFGDAPPTGPIGEEWLLSHSKSPEDALWDFWRLCHRSYQRKSNIHARSDTSFVSHAVVWRCWFHNIDSLVSKLPFGSRRGLRTIPPIGHLSVAGDWYIAVPKRSELPELGARIVQLMATENEELRRLRMGIGLPTSRDFYGGEGDDFTKTISSFVSLPKNDLRRLVNGALERSRLPGYGTFSGTLSYHLQRILETPEAELNEVRASIDEIAKSLKIEFRRSIEQSSPGSGW